MYLNLSMVGATHPKVGVHFTHFEGQSHCDPIWHHMALQWGFS